MHKNTEGEEGLASLRSEGRLAWLDTGIEGDRGKARSHSREEAIGNGSLQALGEPVRLTETSCIVCR